MKKILIVEDEMLVAHHLKLILTSSGYNVSGVADSVDEALAAINENKPDLVLLDIHLKGPKNGIMLARQLGRFNIAFVYLTANFQGTLLEEAKSTLPFGFIIKPFREDDLLTTLDVAFYRHQNSMEYLHEQEMELDQKLRAIQTFSGGPEVRLLEAARSLQPHIPFDYLKIIFRNKIGSPCEGIGFLRIGFDEYQMIGTEGFLAINGLDENTLKEIYASLTTLVRPGIFTSREGADMQDENPLMKIIADTYNIESTLVFPSLQIKSDFIRYEFYNKKINSYNQQHIVLLSHLQTSLSSLLGDVPIILKNDEQTSASTVPTAASGKDHTFSGIVGQSYPMLSVFDNIATVSPLDTSVLILGESGTGKEKIAKSIHALSGRKNKPMVIVNCASLPINLIESELFGHEKGSFTGALERRIGKFEMADGGTIFLDEIGEMSIDLQVKLLRVLQEQEIERIGGKGPLKIDVRIIAATNRNLEKEMEEGRFRLDLYYRLYVFPIEIPPLRERTEDIAILAKHFTSHYSTKYNRTVSGISDEVLDKMKHYHWPGNVRELEHFIERSILLTKGTVIEQVSLPRHIQENEEKALETSGRMKTIDENERDYILAVLERCKGRIRGSGGAAEVMGLPPTTLHSKMKKLGIKYTH